MGSINEAKNSGTFEKISSRLADLNPPILLENHIADDPIVLKHLEADKVEPVNAHQNTLGGVDFVVKNREQLLIALRIAKRGTERAFEPPGTKPEDWKEHWALAMSLLATDGIGFREPSWLFLNDRARRMSDARPPLLKAPEMDGRFNANFGNDITVDFSALHVSIAEFGSVKSPRTMCNVHTDVARIATAGLGNRVTITPNAIPHLVDELLLTTKLEGILQDWFIERFNNKSFSGFTNPFATSLSLRPDGSA